MLNRDLLRAKMIENAAEINRLRSRIHETFRRRDESEELWQDWQTACEEFHARYEELFLPGGPYLNFYYQIKAGDPDALEVALCFLELRPYFFRSGYHWKTILQKCKSAPMSGERAERFALLLEKYNEWKRLRALSKQRGGVVRSYLWPLLCHFYNLFPVTLWDGDFDGVVTVGDLYALLCKSLKVEPHSQPVNHPGAVREPCRARRQQDMSIWAREYSAWRDAKWTPEDVWTTLVSTIADAYELNPSFEITPQTILREPDGQ